MNVSALYQNYSQRAADVVQSSETNAFVANALRYVIQHVFVNIAATFVITTSTCTTRLDRWFSDITEKLFKTWGFMAVQLVRIRKDEVSEYVPGRRFCNILFIDSYEALLKADIASFNQNYDNSEYYFIFLQTNDELIPGEMKLILNYCLQNYWIHCNVMIQSAKVEVLVYTYFPYTQEHCNQAEPVLVNSFNGERMVSEPMFPEKLMNMHECPLILATWHVPPFMHVQNLSDGTLKLNGFEMHLVDALQDIMNFSITVKVPKTSKYGQIRTNTALKMLRKREANFSLGYFRKTSYQNRIASSTYTHHYAKHVATVIRNNHKYTSIELLTFPFQLDIWLIILACLILLFLLTVLAKRFGSNWLNPTIHEPTFTQLTIIEMFMGVPAVRMPRCSSRRIFSLSWIAGAFVLRTVYQSLLFHLVRTHLYRDAPVSLDSLISTNYKAVVTDYTLNTFRHVPHFADKRLLYIALNSTKECDVFAYLEQNIEQNLAAITAEDYLFAYGPYKKPITDFQIIPEQVNVQQFAIYVTKHSYLTDEFNKNILMFESYGLIQAWHRWSIDFKYSRKTHQNPSVFIGQKELGGINMITFGLLIFAFVVFLIELLLDKVNIFGNVLIK